MVNLANGMFKNPHTLQPHASSCLPFSVCASCPLFLLPPLTFQPFNHIFHLDFRGTLAPATFLHLWERGKGRLGPRSDVRGERNMILEHFWVRGVPTSRLSWQQVNCLLEALPWLGRDEQADSLGNKLTDCSMVGPGL